MCCCLGPGLNLDWQGSCLNRNLRWNMIPCILYDSTVLISSLPYIYNYLKGTYSSRWLHVMNVQGYPSTKEHQMLAVWTDSGARRQANKQAFRPGHVYPAYRITFKMPTSRVTTDWVCAVGTSQSCALQEHVRSYISVS